MITQKYLKECLDYNPNTGEFTWLPRPVEHFSTEAACRRVNTRYSGKKAGHKNTTRKSLEYIEVRLDGVLYLAHRLAWLYTWGGWPKDQIDHVDGDGTNNRIFNLRQANNKENNKNQTRRSTNTSGRTGVVWDKKIGKWRAQITVDAKCLYLGSFCEFSDAVAVRAVAEERHGFHPNHGRAAK